MGGPGNGRHGLGGGGRRGAGAAARRAPRPPRLLQAPPRAKLRQRRGGRGGGGRGPSGPGRELPAEQAAAHVAGGAPAPRGGPAAGPPLAPLLRQDLRGAAAEKRALTRRLRHGLQQAFQNSGDGAAHHAGASAPKPHRAEPVGDGQDGGFRPGHAEQGGRRREIPAVPLPGPHLRAGPADRARGGEDGAVLRRRPRHLRHPGQQGGSRHQAAGADRHRDARHGAGLVLQAPRARPEEHQSVRAGRGRRHDRQAGLLQPEHSHPEGPAQGLPDAALLGHLQDVGVDVRDAAHPRPHCHQAAPGGAGPQRRAAVLPGVRGPRGQVPGPVQHLRQHHHRPGHHLLPDAEDGGMAVAGDDGGRAPGGHADGRADGGAAGRRDPEVSRRQGEGPHHHQRLRQRDRRETGDGGGELQPPGHPEAAARFRDLPAPHRAHGPLRQEGHRLQHGRKLQLVPRAHDRGAFPDGDQEAGPGGHGRAREDRRLTSGALASPLPVWG